ncbi:hypothetical protein LIA77_05987 [Sarocladium implicatum]|nr:hypothetical protein LIA77_05987 [Sarocladium implicatum]
MGAIFYQDERGSIPYREFAPVWADRAGKLVLNEAETPLEDNVVTFSILALFWYMQGSWRRSYMHNGNAMQTTHILNLVSDGGKKRGELNGEISRRRFWACFLTNCHTSDSLFTMGPPGALADLQLPWREEDFERGSSAGPQAKFGSKETNGGLYSEMVRGMSYWSSVSIMTRTPDLDPQGRIASIHQLDADIRKWWSCVPKSLQITAANIGSISPLDMPKILIVNIAYYQCLCALHASIVPLFVWGQHIPEHVVAKQLSAQLAYENAGAISRLLEMALGKTPDMTGVSSFVGYAAYCSYAVQIPFHWCIDTAVMETARSNTSVNIRVIRSVGRYWKSVALLETYAMYLANIHSNNQLGLGSEPKGLDPAKLSGFRITAARARSSILSINGILWKEDGFAAPGDEVTDLGLGSNEERLPARAPASNWADNTRTLDTVNETPAAEGNVSMPGTYVGPTVAVSPEMFDFSDQQAPVFFHPFLYMSDMLDPDMARDYEAPPLGGVAMGNQW